MNAAAKTSCQLIEKTLRKSPAFKKVDDPPGFGFDLTVH